MKLAGKEVERITLTEAEFCKAVGISTRHAKRLRAAGRLTHCRMGRRVFYRPEHVKEFLKALEVRAA